MLDQTRLVDHVGDLGDDDLRLALDLLNVGLGADDDLALARAVSRTDARLAHNDAAGREIRPLDAFHQVVQRAVGIFNEQIQPVNDLAQIVRRDVRCHADRDADRAVDQKIRVTRRQNDWLLQTIVIVGHPVDGILVNVCDHFEGELCHLRLGVTVGSRRVAINGTEVAVTIDQRIAQRKVLRQSHERVINGSVTVRMVTTEHRTNGVGALAVRLVRRQLVLVHRVNDTAVHRLQAVTHIRQRTRNDDRHRICQKAVMHLVRNIDRYHLWRRRVLLDLCVFVVYFTHYFTSCMRL